MEELLRSLALFKPEVALTAGLLHVVVVDSTGAARRNAAMRTLTLASLAVALGFAFNLQASASKGALFSGMLVVDPLGAAFKVIRVAAGLDLLARLVVIVEPHLCRASDQGLPDLHRRDPAHVDVAHNVVLHVNREQGLGHDAVSVVLGPGGLHGLFLERHQVIHDGDVMGSEIPDHIHVLLEKAEVHTGGVVIDQVPKLVFVDELLDLPDSPSVDKGVVNVEDLPRLVGQLNQFFSLLHLLRHGLFKPHVFAQLQRPLGKGKVGGNRGGNGLDDRFRLLKDVATALNHGDEVKFFVGTSETIATLRILGQEELKPNEEGWIQLELREPVVAVRGDRYILRRPSPSETLGGGVIIEHQPKGRHKRFDKEVLKSLESLALGSPSDVLLEAAIAAYIAPIKEIVTRSRLEVTPASAALKELVETGKLSFLENDAQTTTSEALVIALPHWNTLSAKTVQLVEAYHKDYPLRRGIPREELKSKLKLSPRIFNALISLLVAQQLLLETGKTISKPGQTIRFNGQEQVNVQTLMRKFEMIPFSPPSVKDCQSEVGEEILNALLETGELITVSSEVIFRKGDYDLMVTRIKNAMIQNDRTSLAEVRDLFHTSRKYAQAILEHLEGYSAISPSE